MFRHLSTQKVPSTKYKSPTHPPPLLHRKIGQRFTPAAVMDYVRTLFAKNDVIRQIGEPGMVDRGSCSTVACYIANRNIETVDPSVPILSMHAPMEPISKPNTYTTHKGMKVFCEDR